MRTTPDDHVLLAASINHQPRHWTIWLHRISINRFCKVLKPSFPFPIFLNLSLQPASNPTHLTNINNLLFLLQIVNLFLHCFFLTQNYRQSSTLVRVFLYSQRSCSSRLLQPSLLDFMLSPAQQQSLDHETFTKTSPEGDNSRIDSIIISPNTPRRQRAPQRRP